MIRPLLCLFALVVISPGWVWGEAPSMPEGRPVDPTPILLPPDRPLDERIDPKKVTQTDLPPLPERVEIPNPPTFRLADSPQQVPMSIEHWEKARAALTRAIEFVRARQGPATGAWGLNLETAPTDSPRNASPIAVAVTALAIKAIVQAQPESVSTPEFRKAVRFVMDARTEDGSYGGGALTNYVTSSVVMALASIDRNDFGGELREAVTWLQTSQWDQGEGLEARQDWFGGAGYGSKGRPDLSNTQTMLDALYESGMSPDEPAFQRAIAFASRAQNLRQTNKAEWAGDDGGFVYTPANGGESFSSEAAGEGRYGEIMPEGAPRSLRSYGSMTYAGFKSMLYAGLSADDVRVRSAFDWIRTHFTFEENPGLGQQGLYYYYHTMARALAAAQQNVIEDAAGTKHNWREELIDALATRQRADGSWINEADRWMEGDAVMATIYAALALEEALKPVAGMNPAAAP